MLDTKEGKSDESVEVPIYIDFDDEKPIGTAKINKADLPDNINWVLSVGFRTLELENEKVTSYELLQFGLISDDNFSSYLDRRNDVRNQRSAG